MDFLKNLVVWASMFVVGSCSTPNKEINLEEITKNQNSNFIKEMRNYEKQRVDNLQKLMNNVVEVRMWAKEKREFLTKKNLSKQIERNIRKRINKLYDVTKTEEVVSNLLSQNLRAINIKIAFANVKENRGVAGTGLIYKTCKGDVLITKYHIVSRDRHSYQTAYGEVIIKTKLRNKEIFYNGIKVNLEKLTILSEPNLDLVITKLPYNFGKKTYSFGLATGDELLSGNKVVKMGNTFGEGIQMSYGVINYNKIKEKIILGRKIEIQLLSIPVSSGDSGGPIFLERNLKFIGTIIGSDPVKDNFSVPVRAYILPWKHSIGKLKEISPYDECSYN